MQPALRIESLLRLVGHVEVTHEDVAAPEADLSVSLLVRVVQLRLAPRDLFTTTAGQNDSFLTRAPSTCFEFVSAGRRIALKDEEKRYLVSLKASGREMV